VPYRVIVDDVDRGKLKSNDEAIFTVDSGQHTLQVLGRRPSRPQSNLLSVDVRAGSICEIGCRSVVSMGSLARTGLSAGFGKPPVSIVLYET
jgi:hypothetical protein